MHLKKKSLLSVTKNSYYILHNKILISFNKILIYAITDRKLMLSLFTLLKIS